MSHKFPLPGRLGEMPFARRAAVASGVPSSRLAARDLGAPFHGVRSAHAPTDIFWRCLEYRQRMRAGDSFSHVTAALLLGAPLPAYLDPSTLHVSAPFGTRAPTGRGIVGHQLWALSTAPIEVIHQDHVRGELFALPVVPPLTMFAQLAPLVDRHDLVAVGDFLVTGAVAILPSDEMAALSELSGGWRGRASALAAVGDIRRGSRSRAESLLRVQLMQAGLPEPELNVPVLDRDGSEIATPDLRWPRYRTLVEYEGDLHRVSKGKFRSDITRFERYADADWSSLRAHGDDVFGDPNPFIARLARRLRDRGWSSAIHLSHVQGARR